MLNQPVLVIVLAVGATALKGSGCLATWERQSRQFPGLLGGWHSRANWNSFIHSCMHSFMSPTLH